MSSSRIALFLAAALMFLVSLAPAQKSPDPSDATYIAEALSAAPEAVAHDAAVVRMGSDGKITTLRAGTNGFSCMVIGGGEKMCADANSMEFFDAWAKHQPPPDKLGLVYMLSGHDVGGSNTDPYAASKTPDNHWVVTGPHVMILGPATKTLGLSRSPEADPAKPYIMWAGTPYEHAMIPVTSEEVTTKTAATIQPAKH